MAEPTVPPSTAKPQNKIWILLAGMLALAMLLNAVTHLTGGSREPLKNQAIGQTLPRWIFVPLTGTSVPATSLDCKGKVVLMNFWGTWCGPCRREFPQLMVLRHNMQDQSDFQFVSVSCGADGIEENIPRLKRDTEAFLEKEKFDVPTFADAKGVIRQNIDIMTNTSGYPRTLIFDRKGMIRGVWEGYSDGDETEMQRLILNLLGGESKKES